MKATLWLWSFITIMLCLSQGIYASPIGDYQYSKDMQENFLPAKRTKPSLSIVNPLDVLRQRLLLEIARRQMRENTKQVEINRAILKNVGKRGNELDYYDFDNIRNINDNLLYNNNNNNDKNLMDNNLNNLNINNNNNNIDNTNSNLNNILNNNNNNNNNNNLNNNNILNTLTNNNNNNNNNKEKINNLKQLNDIDDDNNNLFNNYKIPEHNDNNNNKNNMNRMINTNNNKKINNLNDDDYQIKYIYSLYKNSYSHV